MTEPNTGYYATVVADSISSGGTRLLTLEVCFPRFILAEFNTHRVLSRNSASSRAIPVAKQLERILEHPFVPEAFPINKPGMSAVEYLTAGSRYDEAVEVWLSGRDAAVKTAQRLLELDIHKQTANRVLEPYMWHTAVVTATELENFFNLRISPHAQPEINKTASLMLEAVEASTPSVCLVGQWHLPYVDEEELRILPHTDLPLISAGRCAAVTLLNQQKKDPEKDIKRTKSLISNGHMSPLEHPAMVDWYQSPDYGNFRYPWLQYRKMIPGEAVYREPDKA